jgi:hypothetical protein
MPPTEPFQPIFRFILAGLATWRIAFMLVREDGPGEIFTRLRNRLGGSLFDRLLGCVKCVGVWTALPLSLFVGGSWVELLVVWMALAGVAALIDEATRPPFEWRETHGDDLLPTDEHTDRSPD